MDPTPKSNQNQELEWQKKLLPMMSRVIILFSAFFFIASLAQVVYLEYSISNKPRFDIDEALSFMQQQPATSESIIEETRLKALVMLEGNMADNLYHQANALLMARIWTSYIGFLTGMILAMVGATFVLGKLREPQSEFGAKGNLMEVSFKSTSPGLILTVLGATLMLATILTHHEIKASHQAIYLREMPPYALDNAIKPSTPTEIPVLPPPK